MIADKPETLDDIRADIIRVCSELQLKPDTALQANELCTMDKYITCQCHGWSYFRKTYKCNYIAFVSAEFSSVFLLEMNKIRGLIKALNLPKIHTPTSLGYGIPVQYLKIYPVTHVHVPKNDSTSAKGRAAEKTVHDLISSASIHAPIYAQKIIQLDGIDYITTHTDGKVTTYDAKWDKSAWICGKVWFEVAERNPTRSH